MSTKAIKVFRMLLLGLLLLGAASVVRAQTTPLSDLDALRYIASHPDLIAAFGPDAAKGRSHYETWGIKEGRKITFNPLNYIASHPDLIAAFGADAAKGVRHYIQNGHAERRQITFDPNRYMASYPDLIQAFAGDETKAARHYIEWGYKEQRQTTFTDLDALQYVASFGDLIQSIGSDVVTAIRHYVTTGYNAGRRITFDALAYIASFGDLISAFGTNAISGVQHYINWGYKEGRQVVFDALGYLSRHTDLQQAFGSDTVAATRHYINWGFKEGRSYPLTVSVKIIGPGFASKSRMYLAPGDRASVELFPRPDGYLEAVTGCGGALKKNSYEIPPLAKGCEITATFRIGDGQLFTTTPVLTPDLFPKFKALCDPDGKGVSLGVYNINGYTTANIQGHKDGRRDLVVGLWCSPSVGTVVDGPTRSGLLVFIQNPDGSFTDATKRLFGVDVVDAAGGVPFRMVASDLNGDGYDEVFVAVTGEDGRYRHGNYEAYTRQNVVLTSDSLGRYSQAKVGPSGYHYIVKLVASAGGSFEVLTDSLSHGRKQAYKVFGDQWIETNDHDGIPRFEYAFSSSQGKGAIADLAMGFGGTDPIKTEQFLYKRRQTSSGWSLADSRLFATIRKAENYKTWAGEPGFMNVYTFDGVDFSFVQFADNCEINESVGSSFSLFAVSAQKIVGGYTPGRTYTESDPKDFEWSMLMFGYGVSNDVITERKINIRNFITNKKFYSLECDDLSGDGRDDLFISNWGTGEKPDVYINQGSGEFALLDPVKLPSAPESNGAHAIYEDLDGDRYADILYVVRTPSSSTQPINFQLYRGLRGITSSDLKRD